MTKQNAFTREDLLRCSRGELFGPGNAQLPAPNMLMVDRITISAKRVASTAKVNWSPSWISPLTCGFSPAISKAIR